MPVLKLLAFFLISLYVYGDERLEKGTCFTLFVKDFIKFSICHFVGVFLYIFWYPIPEAYLEILEKIQVNSFITYSHVFSWVSEVNN